MDNNILLSIPGADCALVSTCQGKSLEGTIPCANLIDPPAVCAVESLSEDHNPLDEGLDEERVSRTSASAVPVSKCLVSAG